MTKEEQLAALKEQILDRIESWADMYEFFDALMRQVNETGHPGLVFDALFTMYAFMVALRELPEEGDIKKLGDRMLRILIFESVEKLGTQVTVMTSDELQEVLRKRSAMAAMAVAAMDDDKKPKILH